MSPFCSTPEVAASLQRYRCSLLLALEPGGVYFWHGAVKEQRGGLVTDGNVFCPRNFLRGGLAKEKLVLGPVCDLCSGGVMSSPCFPPCPDGRPGPSTTSNICSLCTPGETHRPHPASSFPAKAEVVQPLVSSARRDFSFPQTSLQRAGGTTWLPISQLQGLRVLGHVGCACLAAATAQVLANFPGKRQAGVWTV